MRFPSLHLQRTSAFVLCIAVILQFIAATTGKAEDGYRLWMRYDPLPGANVAAYSPVVTAVMTPGDLGTQSTTRKELVDGLSGLLGHALNVTRVVDKDGVVLVGTPTSLPLIANLKLEDDLAKLGPDGYLIRSVSIVSHKATVIAANSDLGALYGTFHFLRLMQTLQPIDKLNVADSPRFQLRLLNHWDNLNGSIERGYAGRSLWNWSELPGTVDPRLHDYARANASIGINGAVLNNVNAQSQSLTPEYLRKAAAIADAFRPYGVRVYLVPRFSAPMDLGKLETADPLDPAVAAWWKGKADEIYKLIPDFGGFLIKANSEGQPGPVTYKRSHADGANTLAAALAPHGGIVMWRAFVYDALPGSDRIGQAYDTLTPFDGKFASNVLLQAKNGPLDFQPREPFHPLFGAIPKTQLMPELQITQEYLGHGNHLAYLATMWREFLDSDTYAKGPGSTVTKVADGSLFGQKITAIAGVANTGTDRNWTGQDFGQANWYAYGRLAWNPDLSAKEIATDWIHMTFTHNEQAVKTISDIMLESREAVVDYMTPLGLVHIMNSPHYGPGPWLNNAGRADWNPVYYHRADTNGIGFDRTSKGSDVIRQYFSPVREQFTDLATCPEKYLLFFHRVPWDYKMHSGKTLWEELALHYQRGIDWTTDTRKKWDALSGVIDPERHAAVAAKLKIQEHDAVWWRDAGMLYFQTFNKLPLPAGITPTKYTIQSLMTVDPLTGEPRGAR